MHHVKLEYIWLDGYQPDQNLRSKTKILEIEDFNGELDRVPMWSFDGSSTQQAEGHASDCLLKPVRTYRDTAREQGWLVMCEVMSADGTPHPSNIRAGFEDDEDFWFGFEQEYTFVERGRPLGFPKDGYPAPQGMYYCSVGNGNVTGRNIVEDHLNQCLKAGIQLTGINAEVMLGQWEYQCFGKGAKKSADDLWVSRYLLHRICESYGVSATLEPKPMMGDWNGSGLHTNFSNSAMRSAGSEQLFKDICELLGKYHREHIELYGSGNELRLTGLHETQHIDAFSYGVSDRGASIRIPISTVENNWKGYLEDRRPASNGNPYLIVKRLMETVNTAANALV